jgi:uncharacterized LabA/DUF88 family protein
MDNSDSKIALLIDADNSPASKIELVLSELAQYGVASVRRAYGNWKSPQLNGWESKLHEFAIRPIQQFAYTKGKNATDMAMAIDAMDLMYLQKLDGFGIVSSDCDFTPLVMRLLNNGLKVYGFGEQHTPDPFVNACSKFLFLEQLGSVSDVAAASGNGAAEKASPTLRKSRNELRGDTRLVNLLRHAVESSSSEDGWADLALVGKSIANQASFDPRNYGYATLGKLIDATELFNCEKRRDGSQLCVRDKRLKPPTETPATAVTSGSPDERDDWHPAEDTE